MGSGRKYRCLVFPAELAIQLPSCSFPPYKPCLPGGTILDFIWWIPDGRRRRRRKSWMKSVGRHTWMLKRRRDCTDLAYGDHDGNQGRMAAMTQRAPSSGRPGSWINQTRNKGQELSMASLELNSMHRNFDSRSCGTQKLWFVLFLTLGCAFLAGCPMRIGREFLLDGTFNQTYLRHCEQIGRSRAVDRRRLINAYTALLYMDSEVASKAVREAAEIRPEYGIKPLPGVDESAAFIAMQKLIRLHVDEGNWGVLLEMLKAHNSLLLMGTTDDEPVATVVVALEGIQSHSQDKRDKRDISELASLVTELLRRLPEERATKRQELLGRLRKLTASWCR